MGYTHYWRIKQPLDVDTWDVFIQDVRKIVEKYNETANEYSVTYQVGDHSPPNIQGGHFGLVRFEQFYNSHETFYLSVQDKGFQFCKTAQKPYDVAVTAVLIAFKHHFPHVEVSTDGTPEEWKPGQDLCIDAGLDYSDLPFEKEVV